jgi:AcrR family transcriptional regulator
MGISMKIYQINSIIDRLRIQMPLDSITMDILSVKCGVSRATLYRLFSSRKEIFNQYYIHSGNSDGVEPLPEVSERILKAASTIFLSHGFGSTTIERIAVEARVGSATIYRHFQTKENLIEQVLAMLIPQETPDLSILDDSTDLQAVLEQFTLSMLLWIGQNQGVFKLLLFESEALLVIQKKMEKLRTRTRDKIMNFFRNLLPNSPLRDNQVQTLTLTYFGLVMGFSFSTALVDSYETQVNETAAWIATIIQQRIEGLA